MLLLRAGSAINKKWYFATKIVLTYCEKKNSSDQENLLKFKAEGHEFAKCLRQQEQFTQAVKGHNIFLKNNAFSLVHGYFLDLIHYLED